MDKVWSFLKGHWPAIVAFGAAFYAQFGSAITAYVAAHPKLSVWYAVVSFVIGYYVKSPLGGKQ